MARASVKIAKFTMILGYLFIQFTKKKRQVNISKNKREYEKQKILKKNYRRITIFSTHITIPIPSVIFLFQIMSFKTLRWWRKYYTIHRSRYIDQESIIYRHLAEISVSLNLGP
uniref:Uncharacterized protein n=1 Tax=Rhizophagus irregularis (strain DAOM 181602 / DAOM 197198 / MUCL 43194) TaxID=747089 RepID=U9UB36_RHIID